MKLFPKELNVANKATFPTLFYERTKCYLRRDIYEHMISKPENDYFAINTFNEQKVNNLELTKKMVQEIIPELEALGWKCQLAFGQTGLFIYSDKKPANCYDDGF